MAKRHRQAERISVQVVLAESQSERLRRRAAFLRDLAEAKELRARVSPRRARVARLREALRRATYRSA